MEQNQPKQRKKIAYKWTALWNTTLGVLLSSITGNIVLISLPAIFDGMHVNPLSGAGTSYMMWMLMGFNLVTATLVVSFGRLADRFGRVKLYNMGFAIFTGASVLLSLVPEWGGAGVCIMIGLRILQGVGAGFLFSNSTAIITDAFPVTERGMAMGFNQIFGTGGSIIGIVAGGLLSVINWRLVFWVAVPFGVAGTLWAYFKLHELNKPDFSPHTDWLGNITFAVGLILLLVATTIGIMPYKTDVMGWRNPLVACGIVLGLLFLIAFVIIELKIPQPMFELRLFKSRAFAAGNISLLLATLARGGFQFILIIWLQGIWLPLHGYNFEDTPLWAGIYMLPMTAGFFLTGPLSGKLSDRFGAQYFATGGMIVAVIGFLLLNLLPVNFSLLPFFAIQFFMGMGNGIFAAPNTTAIMNSLPADKRGVGNGMRSAFFNASNVVSMSVYFCVLLYGMSLKLPGAMHASLIAAGVGADVAQKISSLPPTGALFAAFLGYNPMKNLIDPSTMASLPAAVQATLTGKEFFPNAIAPAVLDSMHICFYMSAVLAAIAATASWLRGKHEVAA